MPDIKMLSPLNTRQVLSGPAFTVRIVHASDLEAPKLDKHFVDLAERDSVMVIDAPPDCRNAVWGGLMTAGALQRGVMGVVISGRCRDQLEHFDAGFPVFARGISTVGQSPFTRPSAVNVPIVIAPQPDGIAFPAVTVEPGDWIVADYDGVVCVPRDLIGEVQELARKGRQVDAQCLKDIQDGKEIQETFKKWRQ